MISDPVVPSDILICAAGTHVSQGAVNPGCTRNGNPLRMQNALAAANS